MKHNIKVVSALVALFFLSQIVGLVLVSETIQVSVAPSGDIEISHPDTVIGPRPEVSGVDSFLLIIVSVMIGTGLLLFFIKLGFFKVWKAMFFLAVFLTISVSFGVFLPSLIAVLAAFILAILKIFKSNVFIHNLTELFIYAGIAVLFVPIFQVEWILALLLVISVYDFIAVYKSKHMISIAQFQTKSNVFAGLSIPYKIKTKAVKQVKDKAVSMVKGAKTSVVKTVKQKEETIEAILGGGDIAFPLLFAGVVMESLINSGLTKLDAFLQALIIPIMVSIALILLFVKGKEGKYYPAMPFLTAGALVGLGLIYLIGFLV